MLYPTFVGRIGLGWIATDEISDVLVPTKDDARGRERPKSVQTIFHHRVAVSDFC